MKPNPKPAQFGARLKTLAVARGLSLTHLAKLAGLSRATVFFLASGKHQPSYPTLRALAAALGVGVEELS